MLRIECVIVCSNVKVPYSLEWKCSVKIFYFEHISYGCCFSLSFVLSRPPPPRLSICLSSLHVIHTAFTPIISFSLLPILTLSFFFISPFHCNTSSFTVVRLSPLLALFSIPFLLHLYCTSMVTSQQPHWMNVASLMSPQGQINQQWESL